MNIMNSRKSYLSGNSVFGVSVVVIITTFIIVYFLGVNEERKLTTNFFISLSVLGFILIVFMTYGLYRGIGLSDDFPKVTKIKAGDYLSVNSAGDSIHSPMIDFDGIEGVLVSIVFWIIATVVSIIFMLLIEFIAFYAIFIVVGILYWVYFRALKLVFNKASVTKGNIALSIGYSVFYAFLYLGWIYGVVYIVSQFR